MPRLRRNGKEVELDITSFMNLMVVLVPVLLLNMVFSQITILNLKLPEGAQEQVASADVNESLELIIRRDQLTLNFPAGVPLKQIPAVDGKHDYLALSNFLQQVKQTLQQQSKDRRDIVILSEPDTSYQTIVSAMDTVRSYKAVVAASVVDAELFPDISLGDAPIVEAGAAP
jgi:biopolymer transport protein ExbD